MSRKSLVVVIALVSVWVLAGLSLNAAPQAFFTSDLTLHQTETSSGGRGGERNTTSTMYLSGSVMRRNSSDGNDVILKLDEGKMVLIDNNKKTWSEVTFQELQAMMDKATGGQDMPPEALAAMRKMMGNQSTEVSLTRTGPGENIAGYATEKYLLKGPMEMEIWAAPDLKVPTQYYDAIKARLPRNPMFDLGKIYDEMKKMNGYPVKQVSTMKIMGTETRTTMVVTAVDKGAIPKSTFDVPAGYKKTDFMQK
jgi:hypothetical protein